jgi:endonuclease-3
MRADTWDEFFEILDRTIKDPEIELDHEIDEFALLTEYLIFTQMGGRVRRSVVARLRELCSTPDAVTGRGVVEVSKIIMLDAQPLIDMCKEVVSCGGIQEFYNANPQIAQDMQKMRADRSVFKLLVAVVLSARCTDKAVNATLPRLYADGDSPEALLEVGEEEVANRINTIGLYKNKAKFVIGICKRVIELGSVPSTLEGLVELPGVGRKTANVVLNDGFGQVAFPVDTHVFRVSNRTGLAPGKNTDIVEQKLYQSVPERWATKAPSLLILHGRYTCKSQRPKCQDCPVKHLCQWPEKTAE